ncbi:MAG TPA: ribose 5-phosphate isomerase A [Gaiellaceae bacterium]|nr:ribose 5-phosphate isomerase A [Gaiellaceae bacterium]
MSADLEREKQLAAEAAAELVESGMAIGLGTGSTAKYFVQALATRELDIRCVATSPATEKQARSLGLRVQPFDARGSLTRLDLSVDGADQIAPDGWVVKGNGGAHTREKVVAAASDRFVVIASSDKLVDRVSSPIPLELLAFGLESTVARLGQVRVRDTAATPDGGVLADWIGAVDDPAELAAELAAAAGVVDHGLFPPELVSEALVGRESVVERIRYRR